MKSLYFDIIDGISGDMIVASLLDLCGDSTYLKQQLKKIKVKGYQIKFIKSRSGEYKVSRFIVETDKLKEKPHQFEQIKKIINTSGLNAQVKKNASKTYETLYEAEKKVHGKGHVHFHQVGEIDSIIDIISCCILLDHLKIEDIYYSAVPFGKKVAFATTQMLKGKDVVLSEHIFENITPTGIAIIVSLGTQSRNNSDAYKVERVGYGTGSTQIKNSTNILRAILFSQANNRNINLSFDRDQAVVIQTLIDDMSPQIVANLMDLVYGEGALEVYTESVMTKKSRLGILFSVLSKQETFDRIVGIIFKETSTLGLRYFKVDRLKLKRKQGRFITPLGKIRFKEVVDSEFRKIIPEYDDCLKASKVNNKTLKDIMATLQTKGKKNGSIRLRNL